MTANNLNEVSLLLDEMISPNIVPRLWGEAGIDAVHLRDRAKLQAKDYEVLAFATQNRRAVATINDFDFEKLLLKRKTHFGVVTIPSGGTRDEQFSYIVKAVEYMRQFPSAMEAVKDHVIAVSEDMKVSRRMVTAPATQSIFPVLSIVPKRPA